MASMDPPRKPDLRAHWVFHVIAVALLAVGFGAHGFSGTAHGPTALEQLARLEILAHAKLRGLKSVVRGDDKRLSEADRQGAFKEYQDDFRDISRAAYALWKEHMSETERSLSRDTESGDLRWQDEQYTRERERQAGEVPVDLGDVYRRRVDDVVDAAASMRLEKSR